MHIIELYIQLSGKLNKYWIIITAVIQVHIFHASELRCQ